MGSMEFSHEISAETASEAFELLRKDARYWHGHGAGGGTIAEKHAFKMVVLKDDETPGEGLERCQADDAHWSQDKWSPAACIDGGPDLEHPGRRRFYFFGWAST